jgi:hypothetical protein
MTETSSQQPVHRDSLQQRLLYRLGSATLGFVTAMFLVGIYVLLGGEFMSFGKIEGVLLFSSMCGLASGLFPGNVVWGIISGLHE